MDCESVPCMGSRERLHRVFVFPGRGSFCMTCGGYSFAKTLKLHSSCVGRPSVVAVARRRDRMVLGLHPVTGEFLGSPVPISDPATDLFVHLGPPPEGTWDDPECFDLAYIGGF